MNKKLFTQLKQAYASLGLGDDFLQAQADALAVSGFVTDENLETIVTSQKAFLESVQKSNDKRVTEAVKKSQDAKKEEAAKLQAQIAELQKQLHDTTSHADENDFQVKFNAANAPMMETLKQMQAQMEQLQEKAASAERAKANAERQAKILAKAKELSIPQYRIDEGFNISDTATDEEIGTYLTTVAGNIKNNSLPTNTHFAMSNTANIKESADELAQIIIGK